MWIAIKDIALGKLGTQEALQIIVGKVMKIPDEDLSLSKFFFDKGAYIFIPPLIRLSHRELDITPFRESCITAGIPSESSLHAYDP
jgi:hypothetical protein